MLVCVVVLRHFDRSYRFIFLYFSPALSNVILVCGGIHKKSTHLHKDSGQTIVDLKNAHPTQCLKPRHVAHIGFRVVTSYYWLYKQSK